MSFGLRKDTYQFAALKLVCYQMNITRNNSCNAINTFGVVTKRYFFRKKEITPRQYILVLTSELRRLSSRTLLEDLYAINGA
jgi:hypothetical protein